MHWRADDGDIDRRNRALEPSFYGLIPNSTTRRVATVLVMTLASFCKMLGLVLAMALFIVSKQVVVVGAVPCTPLALDSCL
jgi:hypothetical protein